MKKLTLKCRGLTVTISCVQTKVRFGAKCNYPKFGLPGYIYVYILACICFSVLRFEDQTTRDVRGQQGRRPQ